MKEKKLSVLDCITRLLLFVLMLFFISIGVRFATRQILIERLGMDNAFTRAVFFDAPPLQESHTNIDSEIDPSFDWQALYPFPLGMDMQDVQEYQSVSRLLAWITESAINMKTKVGHYTTDHVIFYRELTEAANALNQFIGWRLTAQEEYNAVVSMGDGYLTGLAADYNPLPNAEAVTKLNSFLSTKGASLIYMMIPNKIDERDRELYGVLDFSNQNADAFLELLSQQRVRLVDLRQHLRLPDHPMRELFYRTDHHWKPETALAAARVLSRYLNEELGFDINLSLLDAERYRQEIYQDWFLGSQGKKVTLSRAKPEDFSLFYPLFDVDLSLTIPSRRVNLRGGFEVIYDYSHVEQKDYYNKNPYSAYIYGDNAYSTFDNHLITDNHRVLLIGDSNDNCLIPFLAMGMHRIDSLDLRHFTGSLYSLIVQENYDTVIVAYTPQSLKSINLETRRDRFDFR